jgi:hypothetical protein
MKLPESIAFLRPGWWVIHVVGIAAAFGAGFAVAHHFAGHDAHRAGGDHGAAHGGDHGAAHGGDHGAAHGGDHGAAHGGDHGAAHGGAGHAGAEQGEAGHQEHHEHTSSEVLRPLMQQLLVDTVQLQGALVAGDLTRAATHADAIAGACEDGGEEHGALPERLGPAFLEHDRELHGSASRVAEAARSGGKDEAVAASGAMVAACQACHAQAPAAKAVDLRVLTLFADLPGGPSGGPSGGL